jgi:hypothetical protein
MSKPNNPPAFPTGIFTDDKGRIIGGSNGMSLRDYFAAKAMQEWLVETSEEISVTQIANFSYEMADAMLKAREEE